MKLQFQAIGTIHSPYLPTLPIPQQPQNNAPGEFWITLNSEFQEGLDKLLTYRYLYVLYALDQAQANSNLHVHPSWAPEIEVGVFASRSPERPNPIGLSIVELKGVEGNEILISGIDVYNGTPLLDLKPYIRVLDLKADANDGWYDELQDKDHLVAHMLGNQHEHTHEYGHVHGHDHEHSHSDGHDHKHDHGHHVHTPSSLKLSRSLRLTRDVAPQGNVLND